jgi:hypothetical protein
MTLLETNTEDFLEKQRNKVTTEIDHWKSFKETHDDGVYLAFSQQRREGQTHVKDNQLKPDRANTVRDYLDLPDVVDVDSVYVDLLSLQIPYNCLWKSCRLTGKYCCKITSCTANTETSSEIMREAGRHFIDKYTVEDRKSAIRRGDTHTQKLNHNRTIDGHCVFGEQKHDTDPDTDETHPHIHCNIHDAAYDLDVPLHYFHSIGPSLFPADILIVDGNFFVTAASSRAKERRVTRWWVASDETVCTAHGDTKPFGILQHPDFDALYADILGRDTLNHIQRKAYGSAGPVEPQIKNGWIHAEERGLDLRQETCRNCDGSGCSKCDNRGHFTTWER